MQVKNIKIFIFLSYLYNLKKNGNDKLPVVYFTELLAEALGVKEEVAK